MPTLVKTNYKNNIVWETSHIEETNVSNIDYILDTHTTYQTHLGFGGAFTESAAYNLSRVDEKVRMQAIKDYFDPHEGLAYNLGRVSIHSCDFSLNSYTYIDEGDKTLESFDISRDKKLVIPLIKDAQDIAKKQLDILGSPWSPPAFMKDNNSMIKGGSLLEEYYQVWANYYIKFIEEYEKEGVSIWGITVQNEPAAVQRWDSCIYTKEQERDFVRDYLGPTLHNNDKEDVNLLIWDHNRDIMVERAKAVLEDKEASKYVWGTAFHWYEGEQFENVGKVHELFPDKGLLFTEGCQEGGVHLNSIKTGERYARNIIGDFNNWCQGYLDWNLFLDNTGGPNHVNNLCDSPIIVDIFPEKLIHESSYYYIGHFSKFIQPHAKRIKVINNQDKLHTTAYMNPDNTVVFVVLNDSNQDTTYSVGLAGKSFVTTIKAHEIHTIQFDDLT